MFDVLLVIVIAVAIDLIWGDNHVIWRKFKHPVIYIGNYISFLDKEFNLEEFSESSRFLNGILIMIVSMVLIWFIIIWIEGFLINSALGIILIAIILSIFLSARSLYEHVRDVYDALMADNIAEAKEKLTKLVSRDVDSFEEPSIVRSSIESLSENFSDGFIAPLFWFVISGLPGLIIYKFVNTADSMIGYKYPKYINFGKAAAVIDDIMNYIPARISSVCIIISSCILKEDWKKSLEITMNDASKTASPNSGWPESSMAGALDISLGGDNYYNKQLFEENWLNESGYRELDSEYLSRAFWIYFISIGCFILSISLIFTLLSIFF
tara:strand:- start:2555 stop:3529 length:975 start_codon:yes stop_codon:yes gene_type:complete